jgi:hypothetical protein
MKFAETAGKESRKHEGYETTCRSYGCKALLGGGNRLSNAPGTDVMSQGMRLECKGNARMLRTEKCPIQETFLERITKRKPLQWWCCRNNNKPEQIQKREHIIGVGWVGFLERNKANKRHKRLKSNLSQNVTGETTIWKYPVKHTRNKYVKRSTWTSILYGSIVL